MKTKSKIILSSAIIIACAVAVSVALYFLLRGEEVAHFQSGGAGLTLTRDSLSVKGLGEDGFFSVTTDSEPADFTKPSGENIFGITGNTVIVPGSMFSVDMTISNDSGGGAYAYWLEIKLNGQLNELAKQLKVTVTADDSPVRSFYLGDGAVIGGEDDPVAIVSDGKTSSFNVRVDFEEDRIINDGAQNEWALFDLIVYAVPFNG